MPIAIPAARQKLIERIAAAARQLNRRSDTLKPEDFIRQYYHGVAEEDLADYSGKELAAAALAHLRFSAIRRSRRPLVRVYNSDDIRENWSSAYTIVEIAFDDMPFLVDSLGMVLTQAGLPIHLMVHPVLAVRRDRAGRLTALANANGGAAGVRRESWQHIYTDRIGDPARRRELERKIHSTLQDVQAAVSDWPQMRQRALDVAQSIEDGAPPISAGEIREVKALLEWMAADHFTFLGYREYRLQRGRTEDLIEPIADTGLGILRVRAGKDVRATKLTGALREHAHEPDLLTITKANSMSTIHRATYLDYVGLKTFDKNGRVQGERRFLGLFTSSVYNR
ncbi:MAG TPA: hypothetical protein VHK24_01980, partial [Steroidobacter sp.]|nr:hypothetical protein [Steroidobacter sp.]